MAVALEVRAGAGTAGDPGAASVTGTAGTTVTSEGSCVRLHNPDGRLRVTVRATGVADLVLSDPLLNDSAGSVDVRMVGPGGLAAPSAVHGLDLRLDHPDFPVEIVLPFPRALLCGAHPAGAGQG
jgi:hypothetical protein